MLVGTKVYNNNYWEHQAGFSIFKVAYLTCYAHFWQIVLVWNLTKGRKTSRELMQSFCCLSALRVILFSSELPPEIQTTSGFISLSLFKKRNNRMWISESPSYQISAKSETYEILEKST